MGIYIARFERGQEIGWGVVKGESIRPLPASYSSLADFLTHGISVAKEIEQQTRFRNQLLVTDVHLLSPVTAPTRLLSQDINYPSFDENGKAIKQANVNTIYRKDESSLSGPYHDIIRPKGCKLIDCEVELGFVLGRALYKPEQISEEKLLDYIAGIVIVNDICSHDAILKSLSNQWYRGKSYRSFCPIGPFLYLLDTEEAPLLQQLELKLQVNGHLRQHLFSRNMLFSPAQTLSEASQFTDLHIGDCLLSGSGKGIAVKTPSAVVQKIGGLIFSEEKQQEIIIGKQAQQVRYLRDGDVVEASIVSTNGRVDLGSQRNVVRSL